MISRKLSIVLTILDCLYLLINGLLWLSVLSRAYNIEILRAFFNMTNLEVVMVICMIWQFWIIFAILLFIANLFYLFYNIFFRKYMTLLIISIVNVVLSPVAFIIYIGM